MTSPASRGNPATFAGEVEAAFGLQFLGIGARALADLPARIDRATVPVRLTLNEVGTVAGMKIDGDQAAESLQRQGVPLQGRIAQAVALMSAEFSITKTGGSLVVPVPAKRALIPRGERMMPCPAKAG